MNTASHNTAAQRLAAACDALSLSLDDAQRKQLLGYVDQLQRWNRTYNLTAIRDPDQMLIQHIFDSLSVVEPLRQAANNPQARVMDVGSGGGLPGAVLAIACPGWKVVCVDTVEKKTAFVNYAAAQLGLSGLKAAHTRVEAMAPQGCDIVISRAFASLQKFAELAGPHVADGGMLMAMKGKYPDDEIEELRHHTDWDVAREMALHVPELDAQRCLLWLQRKGMS